MGRRQEEIPIRQNVKFVQKSNGKRNETRYIMQMIPLHKGECFEFVK